MLFAAHTGLRASEQFRLKWSDIDTGRSQVFVKKSKNGRSRHIPLSSGAKEALRIARTYSDDKAVFPVMHNHRWFETVIRKVAIPEFTWHCLRHTFASRLVMAGVDIRTVAELTGHKTLQMTMRYAHLSPGHNTAAVANLDKFYIPDNPTDTRTDTAPNRHQIEAVVEWPQAFEFQMAYTDPAGVAKSADASDLKSEAPKGACGFNSHLPHHSILVTYTALRH